MALHIRQPFEEFLPPNVDKDGWGADGSPSSNDFPSQGLIPCKEHPPGQRPYPGTMVCSACIAMGVISLEKALGEAKPEAPNETETEFERIVSLQLQIERENEDLRRREIDFAIRSLDVARLEALGAGSVAIEEVKRLLAGEAGEPGEADAPDQRQSHVRAATVAPLRGMAVVEGDSQAHERPADDPGGAVRDGGDSVSATVHVRGLSFAVEGSRGPDGDGPAVERFRAVGVDWP